MPEINEFQAFFVLAYPEIYDISLLILCANTLTFIHETIKLTLTFVYNLNKNTQIFPHFVCI